MKFFGFRSRSTSAPVSGPAASSTSTSTSTTTSATTGTTPSSASAKRSPLGTDTSGSSASTTSRVSIVLLGPPQSGKTVLFKQFGEYCKTTDSSSTHSPTPPHSTSTAPPSTASNTTTSSSAATATPPSSAASSEVCNSNKLLVRKSAIEFMLQLIDLSSKLGLEVEEENQAICNTLRDIDLKNLDEVASAKISVDIARLYHDKAIKKARRSPIFSSRAQAKILFEKENSIFEGGFVPEKLDILSAYDPSPDQPCTITTSNTEIELSVLSSKLFNPGALPPSVPPPFVCIFVLPLDRFDSHLDPTKDPSTTETSAATAVQNPLVQSMQMLADIVNTDGKLQDTKHVVVVLSHADVFEAKCQKTDLACCFSKFSGGCDPDAALKHVTTEVSAIFSAKERSYKYTVFSGCLLEDSQMSQVLSEIMTLSKACAVPITPKSPTLVSPSGTAPVPSSTSASASASTTTSAAASPSPKKKLNIKPQKTAEKKKLKLKSGAGELQGRRPTMEDTHITSDSVVVDGIPTKIHVSLYGVFDGHGGSECAHVVADTLPREIFADPQILCGEFEQNFKSSFARIDQAVIPRSGKSGSTAVVAILLDKTLLVANLGDTECVLGTLGSSGTYQPELLSKKHTPGDAEEKTRITSNGGFVFSGRIFGTLAVSRAFGDAGYKKFVVPDPHVTIRPLTRKDGFLIIACDGLWEKFNYAEAVEVVASNKELGRSPEAIAQLLCTQAYERGSSDNITVVVILFTWA
ncbi:protein serine/threonine phosphatase [Pelomyxa schiedti]|nr:protein serine/threonine phosphatase [Pelomyxa schiedti]